MSTILNALRRVERNRLKDDRRVDLMHGLMNREQVVPKKKSRWMAAFTGALLCIFISLVTLVLSGYFNKEGGSIGEKAAAGIKPAAGPTFVPDVEKFETEGPKLSHDEDTAPSPSTARSGTAPGEAGRPVDRGSQTQAERPDLEISAIVWSPVPADRFAMINSRLVREGDTVKGARIEEVFEDGIRVRYKGATFTLKTTIY